MCVCADNRLLHQSSKEGVLLVSPSDNNSTEVLISSKEWAELGEILGSPIESVVLSGDRKMAMLVTNVEKVCFLDSCHFGTIIAPSIFLSHILS